MQPLKVQRIVLIDERLLLRSTQEPAESWKRVLLETGLMLDVPETTDNAAEEASWSPHHSIRQVQHHLHETYQAELTITSLRVTGPFRAGVVPPHIWIGMAVAMLLMIEWSSFILAVAIGALVFGACGWLGLGAVARYDQHKRQQLQDLKQQRNGHALAMKRALEELIGHSFVAVIGRSRIESCPHLVWLSAKNQQLYQHGHQDLRQQVADLIEGLEARLQHLRNAMTSPGWTNEGLEPELNELVTACADAGMPINPPDDVIWNALRQTGSIRPSTSQA